MIKSSSAGRNSVNEFLSSMCLDISGGTNLKYLDLGISRILLIFFILGKKEDFILFTIFR